MEGGAGAAACGIGGDQRIAKIRIDSGPFGLVHEGSPGDRAGASASVSVEGWGSERLYYPPTFIPLALVRKRAASCAGATLHESE